MDAARQNPLQAAAVGAIAAYPLLALARRIPAPIMMVGAGLFLMSTETGRSLSQKATERAGDLADEGARMAHDLRDRSADALASVAEQASSMGASIRGAVSETADSAGRHIDDVRASMADGAVEAQRTVRDATKDASSGAQALRQNLDQRAHDAVGAVQKSAGAAADGLMRWARENPALAAAAGMAVGGFVASVLPVTRVEARVAETAAGDLRRRVSDAAAQGMTAATGAVAQIAQRVGEQGLTPEAIGEAARDFGGRALKVAEAAAGAVGARPTGHDDSSIPAGG
jgi:hypothetical protein